MTGMDVIWALAALALLGVIGLLVYVAADECDPERAERIHRAREEWYR